MDEKIVIRDFRKGNRFQVDNLFIDEYGEIVGVNAIAVYNVLCRHSRNETQRSFPGRRIIAKKIGKGIETVDRAIVILKKHNIIRVIRLGSKFNNNYDLLNHTEWKK